MRLKAEKAKQQLTAREEVPVMLDAAGLRGRVSLSRSVFDEMTQALLNETIEKTDAAIAVAESKGYKVDEILLVGGSTKMPQVKEIIVEKYGIEPKVLEPDEAVAKGAAIYALGAYEIRVDEWKEKIESGEVDLSDAEVKEEAEKYQESAAVSTVAIPGLHGQRMNEVVTVATTKSYALRVLVDGQPKCCNMIIKNVRMDNAFISVTKQFGTAEADQETAELSVYESDFDSAYYEVDEDFNLGKASLELPGNLPAGAPIQVTFTLNNEGILELTGIDMTSGKEIHATMQATAGTTMSKEDVQAARDKSKNIVVE